MVYMQASRACRRSRCSIARLAVTWLVEPEGSPIATWLVEDEHHTPRPVKSIHVNCICSLATCKGRFFSITGWLSQRRNHRIRHPHHHTNPEDGKLRPFRHVCLFGLLFRRFQTTSSTLRLLKKSAFQA